MKARQQMRAAKAAKYKRELAEAGVSLGLPKPSAKKRREKEEELRKLYLALFPKSEKQPEAGEAQSEQAETEGEAGAEQQEQAEGAKQKEEARQQDEAGEQSS